MSTLVFHQGALGDFVLTFPVLRALPRPLTLVAPSDKARLAARLLDNIDPLNLESLPWHRLFQPDLPAPDAKPLLPVLHHSQLIVSYVSGGTDTWAANVRRFAMGSRVVFIQPRPPHDFRRHVLDWHLQQIASQNLAVQPSPPLLLHNPAGPIVLHPGSGGHAKCWPRDRFAALAQCLLQHGLAVLPLLGEVELDTWPPADLDHWTRRLGARFCRDLFELCDVLSAARLFIGNDAGPTHLAAQLGLPTLALFGPSDPRLWSPLGPAVGVLAPPAPQSMDWLDVPTVLHAALRPPPSPAP